MFSLIRLTHCLWILHFFLQGGLFLEMMRRRFYRQFPYFVGYTLAAALKSGILYVLNSSPDINGEQYKNAFLLGDAVVTTLLFGVIYEIFRHVFRDYPALSALGSASFRWATVVLILIALALAWFVPNSGSQGVMSMYYDAKRSLDVVQVGLIVFLLLFARHFHLGFRSYVFGIALGLGVFAASSLALNAIRTFDFEPIARQLSYRVMNVLDEARHCTSVVIWLAYLVKQKSEASPPTRTIPPHQLETWNKELERLVQQ